MADNLPKNWLVMRLSALGDVALTTGVLDHLHRTRGWKFHFLTKPPFAPALVGHPAIEKLVLPEDKSLKGLAWLSARKELAKNYKGWGLLDLHGTLRSRLLGVVWDGPIRRYPKFSISRRLYGLTGSAKARQRLEALNVPQRYALAVESETPAPELLSPRIWLSDEEREEGLQTLDAIGANGPVCALHPYATHAGKRWPTGHWEELISYLRSMGWHCVIIGRHKTPLFSDETPEGVTDLTNSTDIRQTCALLSHCGALVTNDSGPMHLGTAVGTKVVALFGPTTKAWGFFPSGKRDKVLELDLACRPCSLHGGRGCRRGERCMVEIKPEDVARAVQER
ncbi:glycosyltransferase family 9 protein [Desulfovibrio ferrophilus]|uniref:Glycosyl transferase family 9 n=1 Tax=Desulfovibrio ferrophilus TaxID=241368 RepID=A0A2Z6AYP0_9BACT|nr:glycosyltransferase family 9 protein [Desulfovibrio ferrophilus]BBD08377.1 glycosyl transferase family 9 [Desulfovibrio ferrophilus]